MSAVETQRFPYSLVAILIAIAAINPLAINMFVPAMPNIMETLSADLALGQFILSGYLFATAVGQLFLGALSDRWGRRPVLFGGLAIFVVASFVCTIAPTIEVLIAARLAQGFGGCAGLVLGRAIIRDCFDRERAASMLGYVAMGFATAPMIGPLIGGLLDAFVGWRSIFAVQTGLGVLVTLSVLALPETGRPNKADGTATRIGMWRAFALLAGIPAFWSYALTSASATAVFFAFLAATPFVSAGLLGVTGVQFGLYFMFIPAGFLLGNFFTARYTQRLGLRALLLAGTLISVIAIVSMMVAFWLGWVHPLSLFLPMYGIGFAHGLTIANSLAGAVSVRPDLAGAASGLAGSLQVGAGTLATIVAGLFLGAVGSVFTMTLIMLAFAIISLSAAIWTRTAAGA